MSEENVDTVRHLFDLLNRGELAALAALTPSDFVLDRSESRGLDSRVYRGPDDARRLWEELTDAWAEYEFFETEMIDSGDTVIRVGGVRGRGRGSGIEVAAEGATLWRFRDGRPVSATLFQSKAEALEAAGLSE
jgi:ketosteroid isomerase-like protein